MLNRYCAKKTTLLFLASIFTHFSPSFSAVNTLNSGHIEQYLWQYLPHLKFIPVEIKAVNDSQRNLDLFKLDTFNEKVVDLINTYSEKSEKDVKNAANCIVSHMQSNYNELKGKYSQITNEEFRWKFGGLFCLSHRFIFYLRENDDVRSYNDALFKIINDTKIQTATETDDSLISFPVEPYSKNLLEDDITFIINLFTLKYTKNPVLNYQFAVEFKLPLLVERLTTDPHFQNYLFTYFEDAWIKIEKTFDVHGDKALRTFFAKEKTFLNSEKHHIIISASYLRSTNLLYSLYSVSRHVFETLQNLKVEFEKTKKQQIVPIDPDVNNNAATTNAATTQEKKSKRKTKSNNKLSESTKISQPEEQEELPIFQSDSQENISDGLASLSENQEITLTAKSDSQVDNSLELTPLLESHSLSTKTLSEETINGAVSSPLEYQSDEIKDQEEGEWITVGTEKNTST